MNKQNNSLVDLYREIKNNSSDKSIDLGVLMNNENIQSGGNQIVRQKIDNKNEKEKRLAYKRAWYKLNREKIRKYNEQYGKQHKDDISKQKHGYYLKKKKEDE